MDFKILRYVIAIADNGSITKAADSLFITQSALNQMLLKEEEELGTKLFYRSKRSLQPTPAGEIYITNARQILKMGRNAARHIRDLEQDPKGGIRLGLSYEHGVDFFISISQNFARKYPKVSIQMREMTIKNMHRELKDGRMDLAFVMKGDKPDSGFDCVHLCTEPLICGIPGHHTLAQYAAKKGDALASIDLAALKGERFALMYAGSTMREVINPLFAEAGFTANVHYETLMNYALSRLVAKGLCCTIMPISYAKPHRNVAWFRLENDPHWEWWMINSKDHYLSGPEKYVIGQAQEYSARLEQRWRENILGIPED